MAKSPHHIAGGTRLWATRCLCRGVELGAEENLDLGIVVGPETCPRLYAEPDRLLARPADQF